jgi:hypothetical protein
MEWMHIDVYGGGKDSRRPPLRVATRAVTSACINRRFGQCGSSI